MLLKFVVFALFLEPDGLIIVKIFQMRFFCILQDTSGKRTVTDLDKSPIVSMIHLQQLELCIDKGLYAMLAKINNQLQDDGKDT